MSTNLPVILETKLGDFRRRVWLVKIAEGLLAALFGVAVSYLLVFALDRFFETPGWVRLCLLVAGASTLGLGLPLKWHRWVWRQRRLEDAARLLRRTFPRLGDQLLGIVELSRMDHAAAGRSERLVQAAMEQAADAVKDKDFSKAVPHARHRQWGWAALGAAGIAAVAFLMVNAAARNAFVRWIAPWRNVERFTFTRVDALPPRLVVPYAEPFDLPVRLSKDTLSTPGTGSGRIGNQPWVSTKLSSGVYQLSFPMQKQDAPLALSVGDVRKTILIEPRARPELAQLAVRLRLPAYLEYKTEQVVEVHGGSVSVLKGSQAAFEAKASANLAGAEFDGKTQKVDGAKIATDYEPVTTDMERTFTWKDEDGLAPREPLVLKVQAVDDAPPTIMARRESLEEVVLDSEVVTFDLTASDDFGVKEVGLEWTGSLTQPDGTTPVKGEKVAAAGAPEKKELAARATFCATREGVEPQTLEVRAWATDYLPGREHSRSVTFILHVFNKTDHALWLTEQFGKWLDAAKESYEREQQLHETNKELRALTPAELDRPENRLRVARQAAAENANAARLDSLVLSGKNLVEQATKNDEFDATRLETWATMLKLLNDVAANRMPSVADLLKQSANAAAGKLASGMTAGGQQSRQANAPQQANQQNGKTTMSVGQGATQPGAIGQLPAIDPNAPPKPAAPSISDREPGFSKAPDPDPADPNAAPKPPGGGKLRLPTTVLGAAPVKKPEGDAAKPPESPAQQNLETAIVQQKDLLEEFAKVSDQLADLLASLEASTFVKRFKAASRQQMAIASTINQKTLDSFGVERDPVKEAEAIAKKATEQSEIVRVIQSDLDAYFQRKQDSRFKNILDQMKETQIIDGMAGDAEKVSNNLSGQSLIGSEYWADTLDRWAEELVAASNCKSCSTCSGDSLPPEIVLKVMQALRDEMKLRDETREVENAKPATKVEKFTSDAKALGGEQAGISAHTASAASDIRALPDGEAKFPKELALLNEVVDVMNETQGILETPETGPKAIAAETDAIELLLQAKRSGSKPGGGGGSNPGGGGTAATASSAALADFGPGSDAGSLVAARPVGQATGRTGKEFPDEFKTGLDTYFNLLEEPTAGK